MLEGLLRNLNPSLAQRRSLGASCSLGSASQALLQGRKSCRLHRLEIPIKLRSLLGGCYLSGILGLLPGLEIYGMVGGGLGFSGSRISQSRMESLAVDHPFQIEGMTFLPMDSGDVVWVAVKELNLDYHSSRTL